MPGENGVMFVISSILAYFARLTATAPSALEFVKDPASRHDFVRVST